MPIKYTSEETPIKIKVDVGGVEVRTPIEGKHLEIHRTNEGGFLLILTKPVK